jgi:hypothetical protein
LRVTSGQQHSFPPQNVPQHFILFTGIHFCTSFCRARSGSIVRECGRVCERVRERESVCERERVLAAASELLENNALPGDIVQHSPAGWGVRLLNQIGFCRMFRKTSSCQAEEMTTETPWPAFFENLPDSGRPIRRLLRIQKLWLPTFES